MTGSLLQTTYDLVSYPSFAHPKSHPDRLATVAKLFGMNPAPVENCRVLELGCASGGNLIPMAACLPASQFVGIDFSPRQIADGQEVVATLGLGNIRLEPRDVRAIPSDFGTFDYVIAHGVYSWVSSDAQSKILSLCKQCLGPNGVALVSYGTFPGCYSRRAIREMMQYHTSRISDLHERATQARSLVSFLDDSVRGSNNGYSTMLREERQRIYEKLDAYLLHNDLEEEYHPVYFAEFMDRATRAGLQFLEEAEITSSLFPRFPPEVLETIDPSGDDQIRRDQYVDFLTNRTIRETLLCHNHVSLRRAIGPDDLRSFLFASRGDGGSSQPVLRSTEADQPGVRDENTDSSTHPLSKSALQYLAHRWPRVISFEELVASAAAALDTNSQKTGSGTQPDRDVQVLLECLWQAFATSLVELHVHAPPVAVEPSDRPVASAFARLQAKNGTSVTNLRHEGVRLDKLTCHLLVHLDGTRDRQALVDMLVQHATEKGMVVQRHGRPIENSDDLQAALTLGLESNLQLLARHALLVA